MRSLFNCQSNSISGSTGEATCNNSSNIWRIIFSYLIVLLHAGYNGSSGWKLSVEFFFILSGILLANDVQKADRPKTKIRNRSFRTSGG